jgi:hypothetical protein
MYVLQEDWLPYMARAVTLGLALLILAVALLSWRRSGRRDMQRIFLELDESRSDTRTLTGVAQQLMSQLVQLEARMEDRRQLTVASSGAAQRGYELALQMARNGAGIDEIVSASGVTRHEASLLTRLHNPVRV